MARSSTTLDQLPIVIDGIELEVLNVGIAWPSIGTAIEDAERYIDRMSGSLHATPSNFRGDGFLCWSLGTFRFSPNCGISCLRSI